MKIKLLFIFLFVLTASVTLYAQEPTVKNTPKETKTTTENKLTAKDYEELLAKLKKGDLTIDFVKLRLSYTETKNYSPYGGSDERGKMLKALNEDKFKDALKIAEKMLETNYIDLHSHYTATIANRELKKEKEAAFHDAVFTGLMKAILKNDGLTAETGMISLGISEQYFIMNYFGFERGSKALVRENDSIFDVHSVKNPETNESRKFYFNIDKVFGRLF